MEKIPVLAVVGPTASGKTALAVSLAERYNAEIVSADSMQIYRGMDIATAKPTREEMRGIAHHMIDFVDPWETYSVARYTEEAGRVLADIVSRKKLPIVCGGTGLYADSLLGNVRFEEEPDNKEVRARLQSELAASDGQTMLERLFAVDAETAKTLHPHNTGRILRALEIYELTGETAAQRRARSRSEASPYYTIYIYLSFADREYLYERINDRVDAMLADGLLREAEAFFRSEYASTAVQAIGYKELKPYLDGTSSLEEAVENLKRETRRYAKRQMTWFRRNPELRTVVIERRDTPQSVFEKAVALLPELQ